MKKNFLQSWTIWANLILLVIASLDQQFFTGIGLPEELTDTILNKLAAVTTIVNLFLRFKTSSAVGFSKKDKQ